MAEYLNMTFVLPGIPCCPHCGDIIDGNGLGVYGGLAFHDRCIKTAPLVYLDDAVNDFASTENLSDWSRDRGVTFWTPSRLRGIAMSARLSHATQNEPDALGDYPDSTDAGPQRKR